MQRVEIYDTTLRDGTQREGVALTLADKIAIAQGLDGLGVAYIEAGFPGSNPKDAELFRRAREIAFEHGTLVAFGATRRPGIEVANDPGLVALVEAETSVCTIFGKTSSFHVTEVLRTSRDENLAMIEESVRFLVGQSRRVFYDAEHFFDGMREDETYALATLRAALDGGAEIVVLCDTNGGSLPWAIEAAIAKVRSVFGCDVGIHAHDDTGCAVASSLAAVRAGAVQVQGTFNGYGERCGNANLTTLIPALELKGLARVVRPGALANVGRVARLVADVTNLAFDEHAPYVGRSAFAHKGGVHVAAIRRAPRAYEHVDPALVGNETRVVVSELSGRANVLAVAEEHGVPADADTAGTVLSEVKDREARGFAFESADASVALMLRRAEAGYEAPFEVVDYKFLATSGPISEVAIKVRVGTTLEHTAAEGNGPVSALDAALRKALARRYPAIEAIRLHDYKVRILDGRLGTSATTRVLVVHGDHQTRWTTVGASPSIIEASLVALVDGIERGLELAAARERKAG